MIVHSPHWPCLCHAGTTFHAMCSPLSFILNSNAALRCGEGWCIIHAITSDVERGLIKASKTYSKTSMAILCVPQSPTPSTYIPNQFIPKSYLTPQPKPPSTIIQPSEVLLRCQSCPPPNHRSVARPRHTHACRGATPWFAKAPKQESPHRYTRYTPSQQFIPECWS